MALSKYRENGREFYDKLASRRINFPTAPVWSFPHVPLSWNYERNVVQGLLVEAAHELNETTGKHAYWLARVVEIKGFFVRIRFLGAEANSEEETWRNFATYEEPEDGEFDERIYPVGWARRNHQLFEPPRDIKDSRQDWDLYCKDQIEASSYVLRENVHEIVREENESAFRPGMRVEVKDLIEMQALRPAKIEQIIGLRIKFACIDDEGKTRYSYFHEYSDDFRPEGWWSLIGRKLNCEMTPEYREFSRDRLTMLNGPPAEDEATIFDFKPLLVPRSLAARHEKYRFRIGLQLEVIDPLRPGISVGTIVEVLENNFLVIEIVHDETPKYRREPRALREFNRNHRKYRICEHATSHVLLPAGFAAKNNLEAYFNPPRPDFRYVRSEKVPRKLLQRIAPRNGFKPGQVLEVVEVVGGEDIYVGRIKRIVNHLLLIHFEGWDSAYDHFWPMTSTDIFPVGHSDLINYRLITPTLTQRAKPITSLAQAIVTRRVR